MTAPIKLQHTVRKDEIARILASLKRTSPENPPYLGEAREPIGEQEIPRILASLKRR